MTVVLYCELHETQTKLNALLPSALDCTPLRNVTTILTYVFNFIFASKVYDGLTQLGLR